ncbi:fatty acid desaturase [Phyllobacterium sp. OV277]|uniref:fatty acid desaturase n=1 Tax=Phyllobacterium sp. OV277 TaxID=1882772 RepID=UPI00087F8CDB|nr:fatty acid desaturase [Phyllobacterium sp. OV277]SDN97104.1 Fatty acid desaturase [Phyllobacterium sp. OV277]
MESEAHTAELTDKSGRGHKHPGIEWPTLALMIICYGLWLVSGFYLYPTMPFVALALMAVAVAFHSSLQHEALHGHPTRSGMLNEFLVSLPIGLFYPYRRYKHLHLKHHADERLTDPYDDPESYYRALGDWEKLPAALKMLLKWNNTMLGRIIVGPALMIVGFIATDIKLISGGDRKVRTAWLLHAAGLIPLVVLLVEFGIPLWLYALTAVYWGLAIIAIRSYCEHQWSERPDGRTIIVEKSPLALLFLNNNLHFVHHKRPTVPWYKLPKLYREQREEWKAMNGGYVFRNYFEILRAYAFRSKEEVVHPVLRREPAPGRAFRPRRHGISLQGGTSVPIPAEPPTE